MPPESINGDICPNTGLSMQHGATILDLSTSSTISFTKSSFSHSDSKLFLKNVSIKDIVPSLIP